MFIRTSDLGLFTHSNEKGKGALQRRYADVFGAGGICRKDQMISP